MRKPTIEWQTNGLCNYDCTYCIQSRKFRQGHPTDDELDRFLSFFETLPGVWEIKMSGDNGELTAISRLTMAVLPR